MTYSLAIRPNSRCGEGTRTAIPKHHVVVQKLHMKQLIICNRLDLLISA